MQSATATELSGAKCQILLSILTKDGFMCNTNNTKVLTDKWGEGISWIFAKSAIVIFW